MKMLFAILTLVPVGAFAADRIMPCTTEVVRTAAGIKSFEIHLVAGDQRGYHTMKIYKNEGAVRSELPSVAIFFQSEGRASKFVSVETRQTVMVYRDRAAPTREGFVAIQDGRELLELSVTCYL